MTPLTPTFLERLTLVRRSATHGAALAAASLWLLAPAAGAEEAQIPPSAITSTAHEAAPAKGKGPCAKYRGAVQLGDTGICALASASVMGYVFKEFTDFDIGMVGQRIPVPYLGAGLPMAYYYKKDVSAQTDNIGFGALATADLMLVAKSQAGLFRAYVRASLDGRSHYDDDGDFNVRLPKIDDSYYYGALNEAWVQFNGLKVGIQPSLFGFNRVPSVLNPAYTSEITTAAASFTIGYAPNFSVSISAEDGSRRNYSEGILSREDSQLNEPDWVGLVRYAKGNSLYHFSAARHEAHDTVMKDFTGGNEESVSGWAIAGGFQTKIDWGKYLGEAYARNPGRLSITAAMAEGAVGYLGIPFFAPDYVVSSGGKIERSTGWSAVAAYEHIWAPKWKSTLSYSLFNVNLESPAEPIIPAEFNMPSPMVNFDLEVTGSVLQAGLEHMLAPGMTAGVEVGYTWTEAEGSYAGAKARDLEVSYPHVGVYLRRSF